MSETNFYWPNLKYEDSLYNRRRGWWESTKISMGFNTIEEEKYKLQDGGTEIITRDESVSRIIDKGKDMRKLGRWCWTRYRGK